jgi:hypothetical protein
MLDPDKIREEIRHIKEAYALTDDTPAEFEKNMKLACTYLATNAATLFTKCCKGELDDAKIEKMLAMLSRIKSGNITEYNANVSIGQQLTDEYVAPLVAKKST